MADRDSLLASLLRLQGLGGSTNSVPTGTARASNPLDPERLSHVLARLGARIVLRSEPDYPAGLNDLTDSPPAVFVRGDPMPRPRAVAVVGSRAASPYGLERARALAGDLARLGIAVVSGLARGIDAAAHRGALEAGGTTVAVLPGGLDSVTPRHHRDLAEEVASRGALITEIPSGAPARGGMFVRRNRLIAALAEATVVVEAAEKSGALTTALYARRLGRPVLAVPGDVDRPTSRGCHGLIRSGAKLCECAGDIVLALEPRGAAGPDEAPEARLLAALGVRPQTVEVLARDTGLTIEAVLGALLRLEWAGAAVSLPGQRWARARGPSR